MTHADRIRLAVAHQLGGSKETYQHKDIISTVRWPADVNANDGKFGSQVSAALKWWCTEGAIVDGWKLHNAADSGANRKYRLVSTRAVNAPTVLGDFEPELKVELIRYLNDGKLLLEDTDGNLWVAKQVTL